METKYRKPVEEVVLDYLAERRRKKGIPSYVNPDYFEMRVAADYGIDIDFDPHFEYEPREAYDQGAKT